MTFLKMMNQEFVKLDRFDGTKFTRWQDKMMFLLTALKVSYLLNLDMSPIAGPKDDDTKEVIVERKKREKDEVVCSLNTPMKNKVRINLLFSNSLNLLW